MNVTRKAILAVLGCFAVWSLFSLRGSSSEDVQVPFTGANANSTAGNPKNDIQRAWSSLMFRKVPDDPRRRKKAPAGVNDFASNYGVVVQNIIDSVEKISAIDAEVNRLKDYRRDMAKDFELISKGELPATTTLLKLYLHMEDDDIIKLKDAHQKVIESIPDQPKNSFSRAGIVLVSPGEREFPAVVAAIHWIRGLNSIMPIEVFFRTAAEYEHTYCTAAFPEINVRCSILEEYGEGFADILDRAPNTAKPLAILLTSFKHVYYMDMDSLPLIDPDVSFETRMYKKTGMVLNSDYWERVISPYYYDVSGHGLGGRDRGKVSYPVDVLRQCDKRNAIHGLSTDSGKIIVNKAKHLPSLVLAFYYNLHPEYYDALLLQGAPGSAEKETWAAAATVMGESFYQTERRPATLYYARPNKLGVAARYTVLQPDPDTDYARFGENKDVAESFMTLHANSIKANPKYMLMGRETFNADMPPLRAARYFGPLEAQKNISGRSDDLERWYFENMKETVCDWAIKKGWVPRNWEHESLQRMCGYLGDHVTWLSKNPDATTPTSSDKYYTDGQPSNQQAVDAELRAKQSTADSEPEANAKNAQKEEVKVETVVAEPEKLPSPSTSSPASSPNLESALDA